MLIDNILKSTLLMTLLTVSYSSYCQTEVLHFGEYTQDREKSVKLADYFAEFDVYQLELDELTNRLSEDFGALEVELHLGGGKIIPLLIEPSQVTKNPYVLQLATPEGVWSEMRRRNVAFKGRVSGEPNSHVRLTIDDNFIYGYIEIDEDRWFVEPVRFFTGDSKDLFVWYHVENVLDVFDQNKCASMELEENQRNLIPNLWLRNRDIDEPSSRAMGTCYEIDIAIASDWLMYDKYNQSTTEVENRNIGVLNNVQGNYEGEFDDDIIFNIATQYISTCSTCDPWTSTTNAGSLLSSFRNWGNSGGFGVSFGVASLWTARNFDGGTLGVAYIGGTCNNSRYNVNEDFTSNAQLLRVLQAHELGHNFNAFHDAAGSPFIMAPAVSTATDWSSTSINTISSFIQTLSTVPNCLDDCSDPIPPDPDFYYTADQVCPGSEVYFYDQSTNNPNSWDWAFPGGTPSTSTERNPEVYYSSPGVYDVILTVGNNHGTNTITISGAVEVSEFDGTEVLLYDDFENGLGDWDVDNPDGLYTWIQTAVSHMPVGETGIGINNFNYGNIGQKDAVISGVMDFSGRDEVYLEVEYAHRRRNAQRRDSLNIYLSTNGGQSFDHKVFADAESGNGNFATAPDLNQFFTPADDEDWCTDGNFGSDCIFLDLSSFAGEESVKLRIENVTDNGNNMFINRVNLYSSCQITSPPDVLFTATPDFGCADLEVLFEDFSTNFPNSWDWTFPGGIPETSTDQNPFVTYTEPGFYDVSLSVSNPAGTTEVTEEFFIFVDDVPEAMFSYETNSLEVSFEEESERGIDFFWDFGDGSTSTLLNPVHEYDEPGTYSVQLQVVNDCGSDLITINVEVEDSPEAAFSAMGNTGCAPLTVNFINESSSNATSFTWFFPGGQPSESNESDPTVSYSEPGSYEVTLVVSNNIGDDTVVIDDFIEVAASPEASFSVDVDSNAVELINETEGGDDFEWNFGDGGSSTVEEPVYEYEEGGEYWIELIASNDCGSDTSGLWVEVFIPPAVSFEYERQAGCIPLEVWFFNTTTDVTDSLEWFFPGGNPAQSADDTVLVTYADTGQYDVTLIAHSSGGSDTLAEPNLIQVISTPIARAEFVVSEREVRFSNLSEYADAYLWDFGDGNSSTAEDPTHTYEEDGNYEVKLYAINNCDTSVWIGNADAFALPSGDALINGADSVVSGCLPLTVTFEEVSSGTVDNIEWIFEGGSPQSSSDREVEVTYETAGVFSVKLIVSNPAGSDTLNLEQVVDAKSGPEAEFSFEADSLTVSFEEVLLDAEGFIWEFGNGINSTDSNPQINYEEEGLYQVRLTAWNECDTIELTREIGIGSFPQADFQPIGNTEGCAPLTVQFESLSSANTEAFEWTFDGGNPEFSDQANPEVTFAQPGIYSVSLKVTNAIGSNVMTRNELIVVHPQPAADFEVEQIGDKVFSMINFTVDADSVSWDFGDGALSSEWEPEHTYDDPGVFLILLEAFNNCGVDSLSDEVEVEPVSTRELSELGLEVYPNPTTGFVQIEVESGSLPESLRVINSAGKLVKEKHLPGGARETQLNIEGFPSGIYFLQMMLEGEILVYPIHLIRN